MHPFDGLCHGGEIAYAVGVAYGVSGLFRWGPRLPSSVVLDEWDAVAAVSVSCSNEEGFTLASDEYILFFVDGDTRLGEVELVPSLQVLPTLMRECGKSWKESAWVAMADSCGKGKRQTCEAVLMLPLATPTYLVEGQRMGRPAY